MYHNVTKAVILISMQVEKKYLTKICRSKNMGYISEFVHVYFSLTWKIGQKDKKEKNAR